LNKNISKNPIGHFTSIDTLTTYHDYTENLPRNLSTTSDSPSDPKTQIFQVQVEEDNKRAEGVILSGSNKKLAPSIVCNTDLVHVYNDLFLPTSYSRPQPESTTSCSSISFYWAAAK